MIAPPKGAAPDSVTEQVLELPPITVAGKHWTEVMESPEVEAVTANDVVCDTPP